MGGIYIPGMQMPIEHGVCVFILPNGNVYSDGVILTGKALLVPDHGRLIDADALPLGETVPTVMMHDGEKWLSAYELAMAPTIIPADREAEQCES